MQKYLEKIDEVRKRLMKGWDRHISFQDKINGILDGTYIIPKEALDFLRRFHEIECGRKKYTRTKPFNQGVKVRQIETGKIWANMRLCAEEIGCCKNSIYRALAKKTAYKGFHYEYIK